MFAEPERTEPPPRLPWPWLVALVVAGVWWPLHTYWQSDDWIAVHYASDPMRALSDFWGNQYGLPGLVWFYRPLITLSFALDAAVAGADPLFAHLSNAVAHGCSAMLLGMLVARFLGGGAGLGAALVWGTSPVHAGSVLWAVGRVDSHTVPWMLLSALLTVHWLDGRRRTRWPALVCFALGLCSKELALVQPGIAAVLCFALAEPGRRLRGTARGSWPFFALLVPYFGLRALLFHRLIGGYAGGWDDPAAAVAGLGTWTARTLDPWMGMTAAPLVRLGASPDLLGLWWIGFAPAAAGGLWLLARRRAGVLLALVVLYVGCALPTAQFWSQTDNPQNARLFTLPSAATATLAAAGGLWTALPALALAVLPHLEMRRDWIEAGDQARNIHARIAELAAETEPAELFVAGLPRQTDHLVLLYNLGVDRILQPPFGDGRHRVFALRPLNRGRGVRQLSYGDTRGLPLGATLALMGDRGVFRLEPDRRPRADARVDGPTHLTEDVLWAIYRGTAEPAFVIDGPRTSHLRVTLFTASGYLAAVLPNEVPAGGAGGRASVQAWLVSETSQNAHIVTDLRPPIALDLATTFPVLVEAGHLRGQHFEPERVARDWVWLRFDRGYVEMMSGQ